MNQVIDTIMKRRSVRSYLSEPIGEDDIKNILNAANSAPSGKYKMPRHFIVVTDRSKLDSISINHPYAAFLKEAPLAIIVCGEVAKSPRYWQADCSAAAENILLAAKALGLGSCWCCINTHEDIIAYIKKEFNIPEGVEPFAMTVIGKPAKESTRIREIDEAIVHNNKW